MNIILIMLIGFIYYFADGSLVQARELTPACPVKLTLEDIRALRDGKGVPNVQGLNFEAGEGVEDVHTKLPFASRKFEDSVQLKEARIDKENGRVICNYGYDKTFGRSGTLTITAETNSTKTE